MLFWGELCSDGKSLLGMRAIRQVVLICLVTSQYLCVFSSWSCLTNAASGAVSLTAWAPVSVCCLVRECKSAHQCFATVFTVTWGSNHIIPHCLMFKTHMY